MWSVWLVFCDCGFHSVCPLMDEDKRLVEASWWEELTMGKTRSCSGGQGHAQQIFNPTFCWRVRGVFPPYNLAWGQTMVGVMVVMATSFRRTYASMPLPSGLLYSVPLALQQATVNHTSARDSWTLICKSGSVSCETYINKPILINI